MKKTISKIAKSSKFAEKPYFQIKGEKLKIQLIRDFRFFYVKHKHGALMSMTASQ